MTTADTATENGTTEARAKERVWCPKLQTFIPRIWVAEHLAGVHGVNPTWVIQAYGGHKNRGRR
jgi:hypothetical protein